MSTQQRTLSWTGTTVVTLAEEKIGPPAVDYKPQEIVQRKRKFAMRGTFLSAFCGLKN